MADQVDSMSDAELRTKLAEHGFPILPITASTRKLLVKKLKLVLDNKSKPRKPVDSKIESRRTLARFSSGEESDLDTTSSAKEKRSRRQTTGGAMPPPVVSKTRRPTPKKDLPVKRDSDKGSDSEEEKSPVRTHEEVETVTTRRVTRTYHKDDDYETGSDSDVDADRKKASSYRSPSRSSDHISSTLPANDSSKTPPKSTLFSRPSLSTGYTSSLSSSEHLNSIRSRLGLTSNFADRPSVSNYSSNFGTNTYQPSTSTVEEVDSPYLSNFTRRLSALKAEPQKQTSFIDREINNGSTVVPRRSYVTSAARSDIDYNAAGDRKFLKNNLVSLALVGLFILFFFFLSFMYLVKRNDISSMVDDPNSVSSILCQLNIPGNRPGINCVPKEQVSYAKDLLKVIYPELTSKVAAYKCGKPDTFPYLTEKEVIELASAGADIDVTQCRTDLNNLEVLLVKNPHWGLNVVQLKNLYNKNAEYSPLSTVDEVVRQRSKGSVAISIVDPSTPISCLFLNTLYSAGSTLIVIGLLSVSFFAVQRAYKFYLVYQKRKNDEVYSMVEQIIDIISQEAEDGGEPYISVDHVRDTLILPQNREKMSSIWDAAVKFIQKNESRVRMEVQSVDGEDCRVWRWISAHGSPKRNTVWQGQAFETQEGSVNNLNVSPTPCLKIRHMFDKNDTNPNLRSVLQDAILEKCGDNCKILHIDVERISCCVYVKCATEADAGVVYRSLHGWWYEGKLITVKYLRLERYMQRFPTSPSTGPFLKPSHQRSWDE